jgi:hypothetical protein
MARQAAAMPAPRFSKMKICGVLSWLLLLLPGHSLRSAQVKWWNNFHHPPRNPPRTPIRTCALFFEFFSGTR